MAEPRNIILTGFMGTGKSTVARCLAERLGWRLVDTDETIEAEAGKTIAEIFEQEGEAAFRALETEQARRLADLEHCVVAAGGGFPLRAENLQAAERAGLVVLLAASPEHVWERVRHSTRRPLLRVDNPLGRIRQLMDERREAYDSIRVRIDTEGRTSSDVADEIYRRFFKK